jgi:hypothetical protein
LSPTHLKKVGKPKIETELHKQLKFSFYNLSSLVGFGVSNIFILLRLISEFVLAILSSFYRFGRILLPYSLPKTDALSTFTNIKIISLTTLCPF